MWKVIEHYIGIQAECFGISLEYSGFCGIFNQFILAGAEKVSRVAKEPCCLAILLATLSCKFWVPSRHRLA